MKIVIGHLYYDLLNLYGERGNVLALRNFLSSNGIDVEIKELTITDNINFDALNFIYMGMGTERNQEIVLKHLLNYKDKIIDMINSGKFFFITGNSIELFGKYIKNNNSSIETLGVFDFYTERTDNRLVSESVFSFKGINENLFGFQNHMGKIFNVTSPLFTVEKGISSNPSSSVEGIYYKNFYGTYLIGPILARNSSFLEYIAKKLILTIDINFEFKY